MIKILTLQIFLLVSSLLMQNYAIAQSSSILTVSELRMFCKSNVTNMRAFCNLYIQAFLGGAYWPNRFLMKDAPGLIFCVPPGGLKIDDVREIFTADVEKDQSDLSQPAYVILYPILVKNYPCNR